jgi:hypothetical protein
MHEEYDDLEAMIGHDAWDEPWDDDFEHEPTPHDNYGIEFNESYLDDPLLFELDEAVKGIQDDKIEPNIEKHSIIEMQPDLEIREIPLEKPFILKYLNEK